VRSWEITQSLKSWGVYKADLALSVGSGERITDSVWFIYLPVNPLILIGIVLFVILAILGRKRVKRAWRILSGKA
jgi:hypothetical protein